MLGAVETNQSSVDARRNHADRDADHRGRGDRRAGQVEVPDAAATSSPTSRPTRARCASAAARRAAPTSCSSASSRRPLGADPGADQVRRALRRRRGATPRSSPARSTPASPACRSSSTRSRPARCACSPSPAGEPVEVGGSQPPTIKDQGIDVVMTNWRGDRGAARASPTSSASVVGVGRGACARRRPGRRTSSASAGRRFDQSGDGVRRVPAVRAASASQRRRPSSTCRADDVADSWRGPASRGSCSSPWASRAVAATPDPQRARRLVVSGPRFVPLVAAGGLIAAGARVPRPHLVAPDLELARFAAAEIGADALADARRAPGGCCSATSRC